MNQMIWHSQTFFEVNWGLTEKIIRSKCKATCFSAMKCRTAQLRNKIKWSILGLKMYRICWRALCPQWHQCSPDSSYCDCSGGATGGWGKHFECTSGIPKKLQAWGILPDVFLYIETLVCMPHKKTVLVSCPC